MTCEVRKRSLVMIFDLFLIAGVTTFGRNKYLPIPVAPAAAITIYNLDLRSSTNANFGHYCTV